MSRKLNHRLNLLRSSLERPRVEHDQTTSPPVHRPPNQRGLVNGGRCTMVFIVDCGRPLCRSLLRILFYKMLQFGRKIEWLSGGWWPVNRNFCGGLVHRGRWTKIIWLSG